MQGCIERAAKWFGSALVIAGVLFAAVVHGPASLQGQSPEPSQPKPADTLAKGRTPTATPVIPPAPPDLPDPPEPKKLIVSWNNKFQVGLDTFNNRHIAGLLARVCPDLSDLKNPEDAVGKLKIEAYHAKPRSAPGKPKGGIPGKDKSVEPEEPVRLGEWNFDAESLKRLGKKDQFGFGYFVVLPWPDHLPNIEKLILVVYYESQQVGRQVNRSVVEMDNSKIKALKRDANK